MSNVPSRLSRRSCREPVAPRRLEEGARTTRQGRNSAAQLKDVEDREIERVIKKQEEVGLQSITDGEFRRSWWHLDFLWGLDGIEKHVMDTGIAFAGVTTRNEGLKVTGKVGFSGHPMIDHFKFVAAHTKRTPKMTIPSPSAAYGRPVRNADQQDVYPKLDDSSRISAKHTKGLCAHSPTQVAATSSSTKSSSQCCAIRNIAGR